MVSRVIGVVLAPAGGQLLRFGLQGFEHKGSGLRKLECTRQNRLGYGGRNRRSQGFKTLNPKPEILTPKP